MSNHSKTEIPAERKIIAKHLLTIFGGKPAVQAYHHDTEPLSVDLISCEDQPEEGIISYGTIGLFEKAMIDERGEFPTRIELLGAAPIDSTYYPNIIASIAFCIMRSDKIYAPGSCFPDYFKEYYPETSTPHAYLVDPFLWADGDFPEVILNKTITVNFLQIVGISNKEFLLLQNGGEDKLNSQLENAEVDIYDLRRKSSV